MWCIVVTYFRLLPSCVLSFVCSYYIPASKNTHTYICSVQIDNFVQFWNQTALLPSSGISCSLWQLDKHIRFRLRFRVGEQKSFSGSGTGQPVHKRVVWFQNWTRFSNGMEHIHVYLLLHGKPKINNACFILAPCVVAKIIHIILNLENVDRSTRTNNLIYVHVFRKPWEGGCLSRELILTVA